MQLFGTDGIRGVVGTGMITPQSFLQLGWALGVFVKKGPVIIGKDTRLSGYMLEAALESGLCAAGIDVYLLGPMPTPALAYLTQALKAQAGIMVSASHNPFCDNGVKLFNHKGEKLSSDEQAELGNIYQKSMQIEGPCHLGKAYRIQDAQHRYIHFIKGFVPNLKLNGLKIVLDCAHGANYLIAPLLFQELGAQVVSIGIEPNGYNINQDIGVLHPDLLSQTVLDNQADLGFAFDGDADRLVVFFKGQQIDGHHILAALADYYRLVEKNLTGVVGTLLTNLGLISYFDRENIPFYASDVGDRHVITDALARGWCLGAEPSGHYVFLDKLKTADALLAAVLITDACVNYGFDLIEYKNKVPLYPSASRNIMMKHPKKIFQHEKIEYELAQMIAGFPGKILVRPSGTESCMRLYVETENPSLLSPTLDALQEIVSYDLATA